MTQRESSKANNINDFFCTGETTFDSNKYTSIEFNFFQKPNLNHIQLLAGSLTPHDFFIKGE